MLAAALAVVLAPSFQSATRQPDPPSPVTAPEGLEELLRVEARDVDGLSAVVALGDEPVLALGLGYLDAAAGLRARPDSRYRAGALLAPLTSLAALQLVDEGRLALDAPLTELFEELAFEEGAPELRHLLAHTSGLPTYLDWQGARRTDTPVEPTEVLAWLAGRPLEFEPGTCHAWSCTNVLLLGCAVERVCAEPLAARLASALFEPLGLRDTGLRDEGVPLRRAIHASWEFAGELEGDGHALLPFGMERLCTSAPDLLALMRALARREVLSETAWQHLARPARLDDGSALPASLGFSLVTLDDWTGLAWGGGYGGAWIHAAWYPERDATLVLAAVDEAPDLARIERRLARALLDLPPEGVVDLPLPEDAAALYAGDYYVGCTRLAIVVRDEHLWLLPPAADEVRLLFQGRHRFVAGDDEGVRLTFLVAHPRAHSFLYEVHGAQSIARRMD